MEVPNYSNVLYSLCGPIWMIVGGPETQHGERFPHRITFFVWQGGEIRSHNQNFFCEFGVFFCQTNVIRLEKRSPCRVLGPPKTIQTGPHRELKKSGCLLFVSACRPHQKKTLHKQTARRFCMFSHGKRSSARKSAYITKLPLMTGALL